MLVSGKLLHQSGLKMLRRFKNIWRKKALGKSAMYIGIEVMPRLVCSAFSFSPVTDAFGKTYLTSKLLVSEKVTNSGGLILGCRWAGVNALAQNKFQSTIHLLSQHSLA